MGQQLAFTFSPKEAFTLERLIPGDNLQLLSDIKACASGLGEPFVFLWGGATTGKSHLLQAVTQFADTQARTAAYIPLDQAQQFSPEILQGLDELALVCIDDLQQVAGNSAWELALFNLFNEIRAKHNHLIVSANAPPFRIRCEAKGPLIKVHVGADTSNQTFR